MLWHLTQTQIKMYLKEDILATHLVGLHFSLSTFLLILLISFILGTRGPLHSRTYKWYVLYKSCMYHRWPRLHNTINMWHKSVADCVTGTILAVYKTMYESEWLENCSKFCMWKVIEIKVAYLSGCRFPFLLCLKA